MAEPQNAEPLAAVLARARARDEASARELLERLYPLVAQVVHAHLPRRDEPEDLIQEVFLKMFSKLDQFRGAVPFEHWVARIALTTCLDHLRRQRSRPELRWADLPEEEQTMVESVCAQTEPSDADAPQALALLNRLLDRLPQQDAWLLRQVELEQKSLADVCAATGWNAGLARVRLFRARHRLQKAFRELERERT
jgi:RNA polymerase sigma-70 factor (ECF subfamily)